MNADARLRESLPSIVDQLVQTYVECPSIHHFDQCPFPSREKVVHVLDSLREVLFPGFGQRQNLHLPILTQANPLPRQKYRVGFLSLPGGREQPTRRLLIVGEAVPLLESLVPVGHQPCRIFYVRSIPGRDVDAASRAQPLHLPISAAVIAIGVGDYDIEGTVGIYALPFEERHDGLPRRLSHSGVQKKGSLCARKDVEVQRLGRPRRDAMYTFRYLHIPTPLLLLTHRLVERRPSLGW